MFMPFFQYDAHVWFFESKVEEVLYKIAYNVYYENKSMIGYILNLYVNSWEE